MYLKTLLYIAFIQFVLFACHETQPPKIIESDSAKSDQITITYHLNPEFDSLNKYSYLVYASYGNGMFTATGFFIRVNGLVFFVTAKHVLSNWEVMNGGRAFETYPKILYINYNNKDKKIDKTTLNIDTIINSSFHYMWESPDLEILNLNIPYDKVASIEDYIYSYSDTVMNDGDLLIFGYPFQNGGDSSGYLKSPPEKVIGAIFQSTDSTILWNNKFKDSFNYKAGAYNGGKGLSGSPVFIKRYDGRISFGGLVTSGDPEKRIIYIIRPRFIIAELKRKLKNVVKHH